MDRIVVTGAAGFIGSHLCDRLLHDEAVVVGVDNYVTSSSARIAHLSQDQRFDLLEHDVSDGLQVRGAVTHVLHLASPASPDDYTRLPLETLRAGSLGTLAALDLARSKGAHFLLASTSEVYGDPQVHPQPEQYWGNVNPIGPRSVYDEAKRFSEAATAAYRRTFGTRTTIVRIFNTYGPRMRLNDGRAIPTFIGCALAQQPIPVSGDGSQTRSMCYVDDLVEGIVRLLRQQHPGPMNLGGEDEIAVLELARTVRRVTESSSSIVHVPRPTDDPAVRRPDTTLARQVLQWSPRIDLEEGIRRTAAWFATEYAIRRAHV